MKNQINVERLFSAESRGLIPVDSKVIDFSIDPSGLYIAVLYKSSFSLIELGTGNIAI